MRNQDLTILVAVTSDPLTYILMTLYHLLLPVVNFVAMVTATKGISLRILSLFLVLSNTIRVIREHSYTIIVLSWPNSTSDAMVFM